MKILTKMIEEIQNKKSSEKDYIKIRHGNYDMEWYRNGDILQIYYFGNLVAEIDYYRKTKILDNCGYENYASTTRIINFLDKYFNDYKLIKWNGLWIYENK